MVCVELSITPSGRMVYLPKSTADVKRFNHQLNTSNFKDPLHMLDLLVRWMDQAWASAIAKKCHSAGFPVLQSGGSGKTKMIRELAKLSGPYWVVHIMCRHFQAMVESPLIGKPHKV